MVEKVRHQLFLARPLSDRLEALAKRPGASKSAILADAVDAWLNRRGVSELDDRFAHRLDRISTNLERIGTALGRVERDGTVLLETLALLARYVLSVLPPLGEEDHAGRAKAAKRFKAFVEQIGEQLASGRRSIEIREADQ